MVLTGLLGALFSSDLLVAHALDAGRIGIDIQEKRLRLVVSIPDNLLVEFDTDNNGQLSQHELTSHRDVIIRKLNAIIRIQTDTSTGAIQRENLLLVDAVPVWLRDSSYPELPSRIEITASSGDWQAIVKRNDTRHSGAINNTNRTLDFDFTVWGAYINRIWRGITSLLNW